MVRAAADARNPLSERKVVVLIKTSLIFKYGILPVKCSILSTKRALSLSFQHYSAQTQQNEYANSQLHHISKVTLGELDNPHSTSTHLSSPRSWHLHLLIPFQAIHLPPRDPSISLSASRPLSLTFSSISPTRPPQPS